MAYLSHEDVISENAIRNSHKRLCKFILYATRNYLYQYVTYLSLLFIHWFKKIGLLENKTQGSV